MTGLRANRCRGSKINERRLVGGALFAVFWCAVSRARCPDLTGRYENLDGSSLTITDQEGGCSMIRFDHSKNGAVTYNTDGLLRPVSGALFGTTAAEGLRFKAGAHFEGDTLTLQRQQLRGHELQERVVFSYSRTPNGNLSVEERHYDAKNHMLGERSYTLVRQDERGTEK
jgi:hypothetical protein